MPLFQEIGRGRGIDVTNFTIADNIGCFISNCIENVHNLRANTRQKLKEWRKHLTLTAVVAIATFLGLVVAIANLPPAIQTNDLARWTAKKDFWEWCANEEASNHTISSDCQSALNQPLRPPPTARSVHIVKTAAPSCPIRYKPSFHKAKIMRRFWRAGMVALVVAMITCLSLIYITGGVRRERSSARQLTDPESLIGITRRSGDRHARFATSESSSPTAYSSNVGLGSQYSIIRSRKRYALQGDGGKSKTLKDFERRVLEAERSRAKPKFEASEVSNLVCRDGKFFSMTLKEIKPRDSISSLRRSPTI
ncbi:uncharacterized protein BDZ99DRAFT_527872 [Mytilinidion resinicola]|uniref:Uncharacterized protein n=1 Tax=Mytilinidion resinicola TaxID=574789 RepID=A0A6A6Y038_9PEZI|nr:uncharacterized protein BDZ99DRAFT_527872 [Mytilinidion resinicola]KAF2801908.1 hypothetical protein BDZ99DRAFT_527872 [Mytilinidion resinicola]